MVTWRHASDNANGWGAARGTREWLREWCACCCCRILDTQGHTKSGARQKEADNCAEGDKHDRVLARGVCRGLPRMVVMRSHESRLKWT